MEFLVHIVVTAGLLMVVAYLVKGIEVKDGRVALLSALTLGLANAVVRPLLVLVTFPLTVLTLGLFLIVVNALMLMLAAAIVKGFHIKGLKQALIGSVLLSVLNLAVSAIFGIG